MAAGTLNTKGQSFLVKMSSNLRLYWFEGLSFGVFGVFTVDCSR